MGDYIEDHYGCIKGDARSLDRSSHNDCKAKQMFLIIVSPLAPPHE